MISQRCFYWVMSATLLTVLAPIGCQNPTSGVPSTSNEPAQAGAQIEGTGLDRPRERHCELILLNPGSRPATKPADEKKPADEFLAKLRRYEKAQEPANEQPGVEQFKRLHSQIPEPVKLAVRKYGIRNYSVHVVLVRDEYYAVRYYEYLGKDHQADIASLERDPDYRKWRDAWEACQVTMLPLSTNQWWAPMEEIGHVD